MKLVFIVHQPQARGQEIFASLLGNELIGKGHEVLMISMYSGDFQLPFIGKQIFLNLSSGTATLRPDNWKKLVRLISGFQPDIVQANGGDTLKFAVLTRMLYPYPGRLVFNNGGVVSFYLDTCFKKWFYRFILRKIDGAICISKYAAKDLSALLPNECPLIQIPIGVNFTQILSSSIKSEAQVFVHIGGFTREKNHQGLILMFADYLKFNPSAQLWMIGDGLLRPEMERLAKQISSTAFRFLGDILEPWKQVPQQSILLLPSLIEGMPAVIAEAMWVKIQIIAFGVGGIPEMASGAPSCQIIPPRDSAAFLKAMIEMSNSNFVALDQKLEISRELVKNRYSLDQVSVQFLSFYRSLCE